MSLPRPRTELARRGAWAAVTTRAPGVRPMAAPALKRAHRPKEIFSVVTTLAGAANHGRLVGSTTKVPLTDSETSHPSLPVESTLRLSFTGPDWHNAYAPSKWRLFYLSMLHAATTLR